MRADCLLSGLEGSYDTTLYHCRCKICERANQIENVANGMAVAPITTTTENTNAVVPLVAIEPPPVDL
jgi:hypothetical protein